jgi:BRCA1-associated protein
MAQLHQVVCLQAHVRHLCLQVLRRAGTQPSLCMVLLTFATQDQADSFYHDFNGQPFSSLEPEIVCR